MTRGRSPSQPPLGAAPGDGEASSSGDPLAHALCTSSSWSSTADVELQRDLLALRRFEGAPVTIDRFEVEALVGAGASAAVYAARDPLLKRRVALKVLARALPGCVAAVTERLIREARALAQLSHRNVVTIYEVGQWNDRPFIAMELIEGTTLARWLAAERRSVAAIRAAFVEAGRGLAAAHASGHVHRDFKPANVLVAHDGRVVVSDFGLVDDTARDGEPAGDASGAGDADGGSAPRPSFVGTPAYVAPEQRAGAAAHPAADVYSFALALVEALLGYHPMSESTVAWQAALRGRVPRRLHHEIRAALALQPQQRTPSLGPLLDALAVPRDVWPRRVAASLAIGSIAAFVIGALWSSRGDSRPPGPPLPSPDPLLVPAEIFQGQQVLLGTPAEARDDIWAERARTWLMLPIPARVPCRWPVAPPVMELVGDNVVALDSRGEVTSCEISTGIVSAVASDVTCLRPVDETTFGVAFRDGRIAVYQPGVSGWRRVPVDGPTADERTAAERAAGCPFIVSSRGIFPPRFSLVGERLSPQQDRQLFASGGRTVAVKVDGSIYVHSGDTPPALLVAGSMKRYRFDEQLHYGVVATATHVQIYDLSSRSVVAEAPVSPTASSMAVEISRDGSAAVALGLDGPLLWWRRGERQWHSQPIAMSRPTGRKMSPLGERVLIWNSTGGLQILELVSGRRYPLAGAQIREAQFRDDDQVVAIDEAGVVWRWSLRQLRSSVLADHAGGARMWGFATCDGGRSVLTATDRKDRDILISAPSGAPQATLSVAPDTQIFGLACQGERLLAGTRDGHLLAWDWRTGHPLFAQDLGVRAWVWTLATAQPAGGPRVDLIGMGQVRGVDTQSGGQVLALRDGTLTPVFHARFGGNTGISDIAVSADGRRAAAVASSGELALIDVVTLTASSVQAHTFDARRVRFSEGDQGVVTGGDDGYLCTWRFADGSLKLHDKVQLGLGKIVDLDVRGTMVLVATMGGHVGVWDLKTKRLLHVYAGHSSWVTTARFDTSGQWIASGDRDGRVCLHRVDRDGCYALHVGHQRMLMAHVKFLDDGTLVTVSEDGTARQWNPPYRESNAELACELKERLFDHNLGAATRDCGPGMLRRLLRAP